jgi:hypothetical protein
MLFKVQAVPKICISVNKTDSSKPFLKRDQQKKLNGLHHFEILTD